MLETFLTNFLGTGNSYSIWDRYHLPMKNEEIKRYGLAMWLDRQTDLVLCDKPSMLLSFLEANRPTDQLKTAFLVRLQKTIVLFQERAVANSDLSEFKKALIPYIESEEYPVYNEEHFHPLAEYLAASVTGNYESVDADAIQKRFPELELCF